jgi:hypothetical protein
MDIRQSYINSSGRLERILKEQFGEFEDCDCRKKNIFELKWE